MKCCTMFLLRELLIVKLGKIMSIMNWVSQGARALAVHTGMGAAVIATPKVALWGAKWGATRLLAGSSTGAVANIAAAVSVPATGVLTPLAMGAAAWGTGKIFDWSQREVTNAYRHSEHAKLGDNPLSGLSAKIVDANDEDWQELNVAPAPLDKGWVMVGENPMGRRNSI